MREGLPICSVTTTTLSGAGSDPKLLEQKTWMLGPRFLCSCVYVFPSPQSRWDPCPREGIAKASGAHVQSTNAVYVQAPMVLLRCSLRCKSLLSLRVYECPSLHHLHLVVEILHRVGRTCMDSWHVWGVSYCEVTTVKELGYFWGTAWLTPTITTTTTPSLCARTRYLCIPRSSLVLGCGHPRSSAMMWYGRSGARTFTWPGLEHVKRWLQDIWKPLEQTSLCSASGAS